MKNRTAATWTLALAALLGPAPILFPATAHAQDPPEEPAPVTAEALDGLFPDRVGPLGRTSLRTGYRDDGYPMGEAEYGGSEGPAGAGSGAGAGVSLHAGLAGELTDVDRLLDRARANGDVTEATYRGHRVQRFRLGAGTRGTLLVAGDDPRAVLVAVAQGEGGPGPDEALAQFDLDRLLGMATGYRAPSFRTTDHRPALDGRSRAEGAGAVLTVSHPDGWTVQDLTDELDHPYLLLSQDPVSRHLLVDDVHRDAGPALDGNVVVLVSVAFVEREVEEALGHYGVADWLMPDWEMVHDRRRVRVGEVQGQDRLVRGADRGGTPYRSRQLVFRDGGRLVYVHTLEPDDRNPDVAAAVEQIVESVSVRAGTDG